MITALDTAVLPEHWTGMPTGQLTAEQFSSLVARNGRNSGPHLMHDLYYMRRISTETLTAVICEVWSDAEYPQSWLGRDGWVDFFRLAGYTRDGVPATPPDTITLYRGCPPSRTRGMSWSSSIEQARWFAERARFATPGNVYTATVTGEQLLAEITIGGEDEFVVDTRGIQVARVSGGAR